MWANFKSMPRVLKFITAHALCCFAFLVMSVVPNDFLYLNGQNVTYSEWWSSGAGPFASLIGIVGPIVGWLLLSKKPHARAEYLAFSALALIVPFPLMGDWATALIGVLFVCAEALYLYKWRGVQVYFALR
jgi:hypothetical protein